MTRNDGHKLTLARLEWEFEQRKRLSEQCRELEVNREKASVSITQKQKQLESLLPRLNTILEVNIFSIGRHRTGDSCNFLL